MVENLFNPILLFILPIALAFLLPLFDKLGKSTAHMVHMFVVFALVGMTGFWASELFAGGEVYEIITGGWAPPYGINLRLGVPEVILIFLAQVTALFGAAAVNRKNKNDDVRGRVIQLVLLVGAMGLIMTRDLFNVFVFIEITGITTYGLAILADEKGALEAGFKYMLLGSIASIFLLIGIVLIYKTTGSLNIDEISEIMPTLSPEIASVLGLSFAFLLAAFAAELKLFPVNAPGIDIYEGVNSTVVALLVATSVNGILYAFYKILSFFPHDWLLPVVILGLATFVTTNLIANRQDNVRRMLGYSSSGQVGLVVALMPLVYLDVIPLYALGLLVVNHTLAKVLLLGLAGLENKHDIKGWRGAFSNNIPLRLGLFTAVLAITGLPPFPGFFGKWEAVVALSSSPAWWIIAPILIGSILEFGYYNRLIREVQKPRLVAEPKVPLRNALAPTVFAFALIASGAIWVWISAHSAIPGLVDYAGIFDVSKEIWLLTGAGIALITLKEMPEQLRSFATFAVIIASSIITYSAGHFNLNTLSGLFAIMIFGGAMISTLAGMSIKAERKSFHGLFLLLIASVALLIQDTRFLPFFVAWEVMTWTSYMIIGQGKKAQYPAWIYMLFSGAAGFLLLAGMLVAYGKGVTDFASLATLTGKSAYLTWGFMASGILIKSGAIGVHVWAPDAYTESPDTFTIFLSGVLSKIPVFALILVLANLGNQVIRTDWMHLGFAHILAWISVLTAFGMTLLAVFQEDAKKMLAYSSLGQVGYIVMGLALMSPLGWTAAIYHSIHHLIFKGLLFLAIAGVIHRTGTRKMYELGGLIHNMPFSYVSVMIGIIALSGVPPLGGFMGKWLLYQAIFEEGYLMLAGFTMFASLLAFLYLFRIVHSIFLGQRKRRHADVKEVPLPMILAQVGLWGAIMVLAIWPQIILIPINGVTGELLQAAPGLTFAHEIVTPLGTIHNTDIIGPLGYVSPVWIMGIVGVLFVGVLAWMQPVLAKPQRVNQLDIVYSGEVPPPPEEIHFAFDMHKPTERVYEPILRPRAKKFWSEFGDSVKGLAEAGRRFYTGDAQTYVLYLVGLAAILGLSKLF